MQGIYNGRVQCDVSGDCEGLELKNRQVRRRRRKSQRKEQDPVGDD